MALAAALVVTSATPAAAAPVLVTSWNMGDGGSTMSDATGRGHTGTLRNVTVRQPGVSGYGYGFFKTPSYVSVPSSGDFRPGTGNMKITMSVRFAEPPTTAVKDYDLLRVGLSTTAGGSYKVEVVQNGRGYCNFRGSSGGVSISAGPNLADDRWHRMSCARSGNAVVLTVDGTSYSRSGPIGSITSSATLYIGAKDGGGADQYTGLMDSVTITKG
ncbi:laminin G domain-containing protein [Modestobacter sp. URMC 112]